MIGGALLGVAMIVILPLAFGVILATAIGGWASVAIALVSWTGLGLLLAVGLRLAIRAFWPIRSLIDTAGRLADGDYAARVKPIPSGPIREVVESFNRMADRLETADDQRRQLLAEVGHELRTPLTIIRGELEAMVDGVRQLDDGRVHQLLTDVGVMERLLDDLRTLSTAEAGRLEIHREPTDLVRLIGDTVDRFRAEAVEAGVALVVEVADDDLRSTEANVDSVRVREVVANLVANGLRATDPGDRVVVSVDGREIDGKQHAVIDVVDTGRGIRDEELDRVFDRFHKGSESDGTGLGLTITRNLVEAHGGSITIESELGHGTRVSVMVPLGLDEV